jgi:uncharacterized membrane protein HdeD (DUF308 family)
MATAGYVGTTDSGRPGAELLRKKWGWFVALGILLIFAGTLAAGSAFFMTVFSMMFLGWLMIVGGIFQALHAFGCKEWGGFFIDLLTGLLYLVVGFMCVANPGATAVALTLLIAMFLIFGGIFRVAIALATRYEHWGWLLLHGAVSLLLGIAIWRQWPVSGLWVIGLFVGIDLMLNGWSLVMLGMIARHRPTVAAPVAVPAV